MSDPLSLPLDVFEGLVLDADFFRRLDSNAPESSKEKLDRIRQQAKAKRCDPWWAK